MTTQQCGAGGQACSTLREFSALLHPTGENKAQPRLCLSLMMSPKNLFIAIILAAAVLVAVLFLRKPPSDEWLAPSKEIELTQRTAVPATQAADLHGHSSEHAGSNKDEPAKGTPEMAAQPQRDAQSSPPVKATPKTGPQTPIDLNAEFADNFDSDRFDSEKWTPTSKNDFSESKVDVVNEADGGGGRLRLRCATMNTDDTTVKHLGVVSVQPLVLAGSKRLKCEFDWNEQLNGCYLTGAIYLCPTLTTKSPEDEDQWLRLEYVGVPPGKNARAAIWFKNGGIPNWLYDEGWPKEQRQGRRVGRLAVEISIENGRWAISEHEKLLYESTNEWKLPFDNAHLYLQMTSHSNYPPREILFDNVTFGAVAVRNGNDDR